MAELTVCIPTYNRRDTLRAALDSVFAQTWTDFEVLVVDDGSTDGTAEMLADCPHPVRLVRQENRGEPAARNRLIAETHTRLLAWLDSDDLWLPEKLQRQMAMLAGAGDRAVAFSPKMTIDAAGRVVRRESKPVAAGQITAELFEHIFIPLPSVVMPIELAREAGGFDPDLPVLGDYRMWLELSKTCGFLPADEPLVMCRRHGGNLSANSARNQAIKVRVLEEFYHERGGDRFVPRRRAMRRLARECRKAADLARREDDAEAARLFAGRAIRYRLAPRTAWSALAARFA